MMMASNMSENRHSHGEIILSGQFMVSHFEKDDDDEPDDDKVILSPQHCEPSAADPVIGSTSVVHSGARPYVRPYGMELQRYDPSAVAHYQKTKNEKFDIEKDLSKIFTTLNVTYQQKLTSPKWNAFKGIHLRGTDKVRMNNVIWRCWHMQFILKRKTKVCQFASPLDTDVHVKPQAIILEGKYWKRHEQVIINEYKRWRRNYFISALQSETGKVSNVSYYEWSPNTSNMLQNYTDDMIVPYSYAEPAKPERADFCQPTCLDNVQEFDLQFFLNDFKLPSVPEEDTAEMLPAIENNPSFSEMDSSDNAGITPMSIDTTLPLQQQQSSPFCDQALSDLLHLNVAGGNISNNNAFITTANNTLHMSMTQQQQVPINDTTSGYRQKNFRPLYKTNRRERINYEKSQPTQHQTNAYNQMMLQHQQQQQQQQQQNQQQQNSVINYPSNAFSPIQTTTNNFHPMPEQQMSTTNMTLSNAEMEGVFSQVINTQMMQNANIFGLQQQPQGTTFQNPMNRQMLRQPSPPQISSIMDQQIAPQTFLGVQQQATAKEIGRSSSLPVNSTFQSAFVTHSKDESFAMPKFSRSRSRQRSNSINLHRTANNTLSGMQSTNSEPMLNVNPSSLIAQLLTSNDTNLLTKHSISTNALNVQQQQQQRQQQVKQNLPKQNIPQALPPALQQKSLTFPTPAVQNQLQHQTASTGMSTAILSSLKKNIQHQSFGGSQGFSTSTTSISLSTPSLSPDSALDIDMPMSPLSRQNNKFSAPSTTTRERPARRAGHIHAEQKRRCSIQHGFDTLHSLIPELQSNPSAKMSKAAMLQKGAAYIRHMHIERTNLKERMDSLRQEVETLNNSLSHLQTALPADGAPLSKQRNSRMTELYEAYVRYRTNDHWKYWVFGLIFEPMMQSFNATVSVASMDDLIRTTNNWVDQHCSLIELRPAVSNKLRILSTTTDLLAERSTTLQQEVQKAMAKSNSCGSSSSSGYQSK